MGDIQRLDIENLKDSVKRCSDGIVSCLNNQIDCCKDIESFRVKFIDEIVNCLKNQIVCYKDISEFDKRLSEFNRRLSKFDKRLSEIDSKLLNFDDKRLFRGLLLHYKYKELSKKGDNTSKMLYLFFYLFLFLCIVYCTIIIIINLL